MSKNNISEIENINVDENIIVDDVDKKCAPGITFEDGSCIRLAVLVAYATAYNADNNHDRIKLYPEYEILNPKKYKRYLVKELMRRLRNVKQRDWYKQKFVKKMEYILREELTKYSIRPNGPQGRFEWLNTLNIDDVMRQYEKKYTDFKFLGTVPIDFDDLHYYNIKDLNYNDLYNKKIYRLGFVFNLDRHDQKGSHWVALYANLKKSEILFFDSYGIEPHARIRTLMRRIARFCHDKFGVEPKADWNRTQHQKENSECGVYSMNFILRMLRGDSFDDICNTRIPDKTVNKCRNVYFNNSKIKE